MSTQHTQQAEVTRLFREMTLAGVPASGGWCVDSVNIDVNHMDMDVNFSVVILCRTCMSVILTCMPLDVLGSS